MSFRAAIAKMDLCQEDRAYFDAMFAEEDRVEAENGAKWAQHARIAHEYGHATADIALAMLTARGRGYADVVAWNIAAESAHRYLVATSASQ